MTYEQTPAMTTHAALIVSPLASAMNANAIAPRIATTTHPAASAAFFICHKGHHVRHDRTRRARRPEMFLVVFVADRRVVVVDTPSRGHYRGDGRPVNDFLVGFEHPLERHDARRERLHVELA